MTDKQIDEAFFDSIELDAGARGSINYAKAREAIDQTMENRANKRKAKMIVIDWLGGKVEVTKTRRPDEDEFGNNIARKSVVFPDGSKARF